MSDKYFVDTNILMYTRDTSAGAKHDRAKAVLEELWRGRTGVVSTQVLQELSVGGPGAVFLYGPPTGDALSAVKEDRCCS